MTHAETGWACVLPACGNTAPAQDQPCSECAAAWGPFLRPRLSERSPADAQPILCHITDRSAAAGDLNATSIAVARAASAGNHPAMTAKPPNERKRNQRCWLCEEKHTCTKEPNGWECDHCRQNVR